ncbi:uncharacterized protein LOC131658799 [Vicia villosa]|uniref:uncharacterized protein LOC131658799 n=1 Tax=Vicia villosa TaxID=3911 RepID=UPI00273C1DBE|nr:uncharacterized protein LOC131658799 [Vicia villosa]
MLTKGAKDWWSNTRHRFNEEGIEITWRLFRSAFLKNYFPEDVRGKKEVGFLELKRERGRYRGKPYEDKKKQEAGFDKKTSGGDAPTKVVCFKYGLAGHKRKVCNAKAKKCYRCGKTGHMSSDCRHKDVVCFTCGVEGNIDSQCQKPKKESGSGKVFALVGTQTATEDGNVGGEYFISSTFN